MTEIAPRREGITAVTLRPAIVFGGDKLPDAAAVDALHHSAHDHCYIANSIRAEVKVDGTWSVA
jgi:organic hydroperoxide reductase OsmC/OhrA